MNNYTFNYIITIHNKEHLIENVVLNVLNCMNRASSTLYLVLDGCTDNTESIVNQMINTYYDFNIIILYMPDVHELLSINEALNNSKQEGDGFNIVLQDDVLLSQENLEDSIVSLYREYPKLGIVSFRHGANLSRKILSSTKIIMPFINYVESEKGHNPTPLNSLAIGQLCFREIAIKSPICIPFSVVRNVGIPDETFAPWDDIEYCYRVSLYGYHNAVFAINFISEVEWGTTRNKKQKESIGHVQSKNLDLFKKKHKQSLPKVKLQRIYQQPIEHIFISGQKRQYSIYDYYVGIKSVIYENIKLFYKLYIC